MGAYFIVVNPAKREFLDPSRFGEGIKFSVVLTGDHCLLALKLLIADCFERNENSFRGAWLGDPVILASDDYGVPNPPGVTTSAPSDATRNLSAWAREEFSDISHRALAELCKDALVAAELAHKAKEHRDLLIDLGFVVEQYCPPALEPALEEAVGKPWRKAFNKAVKECSFWRPPKPVVWPL
jgi:hypothetical protein